MNEKKADNTILPKKREINEIDNQLDAEKKHTKKLEKYQDDFHNLHKNMNNCLNLLSRSIKGPSTEVLIDDMRDSNETIYSKINENINVELKAIKKRVNKLYAKKEEIIMKKNKE